MKQRRIKVDVTYLYITLEQREIDVDATFRHNVSTSIQPIANKRVIFTILHWYIGPRVISTLFVGFQRCVSRIWYDIVPTRYRCWYDTYAFALKLCGRCGDIGNVDVGAEFHHFSSTLHVLHITQLFVYPYRTSDNRIEIRKRKKKETKKERRRRRRRRRKKKSKNKKKKNKQKKQENDTWQVYSIYMFSPVEC